MGFILTSVYCCTQNVFLVHIKSTAPEEVYPKTYANSYTSQTAESYLDPNKTL